MFRVMKWPILVYLCMTVLACCAEDAEDKVEETSEENGREVQGFNQETWKALDAYPEGNFRWVPQPTDEPLEYKPKRRRLRKRKRRPPISPQDDYSADETFVERPLRRRLRPFRLQQSQEPWEELQNDPQIRPNVRRRVIPDFRLPSEPINSREPSFEFPPKNKIVYKHINQESLPIDVSENETTESQNGNPVSDLKNLLKQSGGTLSLSEILQQKNLSLAELLSGNEKAISALTEKTVEVTEQMSRSNVDQTTNHSKYLTLVHKTTDRNFIQAEDSSEVVPPKETLEMQRKRLAAFSGPKGNQLFPTVIKMDVITEATTERRIFVPSHPKYYTSIYYKPDFNSDSKQITQSFSLNTASTTSTTTSTKTPETTRLYIKQLPINNTEISISVKEAEEENYPVRLEFPMPTTIDDYNQVKGIEEYKEQVITQKSTRPNDDRPMKLPIDIDIIMEKNMQRDDIASFTEVPTENMTYINARDEIMEILKDPDRKERLAKILELRNMTIEELVQQRERGSSQRHLADIFHNKNKEPEPLGEPHIVSVEGHFDHKQYQNVFERQEKSQKLSETDTIKEVLKVEEKEEIKISEAPKLKEVPVNIDAPSKIDNKIESFRWIGEIIPVLPKTDEKDVGSKELSQEIVSTEDYYLEHNPRLETIDNTFSLSSNEELSIDEDHSSEQVFIKIPSGVKSAIFVSLAIIGLSMLVFLTIFMIFKWSQKQTRAINYCSSLSAKLRSPIILQGGPTTAIKTFVSETLGRKKNYYKSNVQRMCDDIWEGGAEKKLSF